MDVVGNPLISAEYGDTFQRDGETVTLVAPGNPNIVYVGNNIMRITIDGAGGGIAYRDYNIETGELGDIMPCTVSGAGIIKGVEGQVSLTLANYKEHYINSGNSTTLQLHSQYAKINGVYYVLIGNGSAGTAATIFTTTDFKNFTFWACPNTSSGDVEGLEYEMALFPYVYTGASPWKARLVLAMRRSHSNSTYGKRLYVASISTGITYQAYGSPANPWGTDDSVKGRVNNVVELPCDMSRPCFFTGIEDAHDFVNSMNRPVYLLYNSPSQEYNYREFVNVCLLSAPNSFVENNVRIVAQGQTMTYPSVVYSNGEYYVSYQSGGRVYLSKFKPFSASWDKVIPTLNKMLDIFMPE